MRLNNAAYPLDPAVFPNATALKANTALGRLNVSRATGDLDGDGDYDRIDVFGARSISVRDELGRLLWDSGDMFERLSEMFDIDNANTAPGLTLFNTTNSANTRDNRSDDKGVEPESGESAAGFTRLSDSNATAASSSWTSRSLRPRSS